MKKLICLLASIILLSGCSSSEPHKEIGEFNNSNDSETTNNEDNIKNTSYSKYLNFVVDNSYYENTVFSPESFNSALYMYSDLIENPTEVNKFLNNKNYLNYKNTDVFNLVNRIWVNDKIDFNYDSELIYKMDMSDEAKATKEKDDFIRDNTNGFIDSTPIKFNNETLFDIMNVAYLKDTWALGELEQEDTTTQFQCLDGTSSDVYMLVDSNGALYESYDSYIYKMRYSDGFEFVVVLPETENNKLNNIDIDSIINNDITRLDVKPIFKMPEFEITSNHDLDLTYWGLDNYPIKKEIFDGTYNVTINQVAKIKVDKEGTEAAATTTMTYTAEAIQEPKTFELVCDRPFIYYIYDTENNDLAFIGAVTYL